MKKAASILITITLGLIAVFLLLEAAFQARYYIKVLRKKNVSAKKMKTAKKTLTILCVGESMTACSPDIAYSTFLQKSLRAKYPETEVNVINSGIPRSTSKITLRELPADIERFAPDIVVSMIGINDVHTLFTKEHINSRITPSFWNNFRSIYFIKYLLFELKAKNKKQATQPKIPVDFDAQFNYYMQAEQKYYFSEIDDHYLLDRIMLKAAKTDFAKNFWQAQQALNEKQPQKALELLEKATKINPKRPELYALMYMAQTSAQMQPSPELKKLCRKYSKNEADFLRKWGLFCRQNKLPKQAHAAFKAGQKLQDPEALEFAVMAANLNWQTGKFRLAAQQFKDILKQSPDNLEALCKLGLIYSNTGHLDKARMYFEHLIKLTSDYNYAQYTLGKIYAQMYQDNPHDKSLLEKAQKHIEQAYHHNSALDWGENKLLAKIYEQLGNTKKLNFENEQFRQNYQKIFTLLEDNNIKLIAMQYPQRNIEDLKKLFPAAQREKILFVDNRPTFDKLLKNYSYEEIFIDNFAGNFGHYTALGGKAIARNVQKAVEKYANNQ